MKVIKIKRKTPEYTRWMLYTMSKNELHMYKAYIDVYNPLFEMLQEVNTRPWHTQAA
jgi:hypothetical protein